MWKITISGKFQELPEIRHNNSSIKKESLCSPKPGCREAQLVKCLVIQIAQGPKVKDRKVFNKDSHPAVVEQDCPLQRQTVLRGGVSVKTPLWFEATCISVFCLGSNSTECRNSAAVSSRALVHGDLSSSRSHFSSWAEDYIMRQRLACSDE